MMNLKFYLLSFTLLISFQSFSQVKMNIWDKNPNVARTVNKLNSNSLPTTFESILPGGGSDIYERVKTNPTQYESSDGKKWISEPIVYRSKNNFGAVTYTNEGWQGLVSQKEGKTYSMTPSKVILDTVNMKEGFCNTIEPPQQIQPKKESKVPSVGRILSSQFYEKTPILNKVVTCYFEVGNDVYIRLGSNITNAQNYMNALFANVQTVYANEGISLQLNKVYIWVTTDPYINLDLQQGFGVVPLLETHTLFKNNILNNNPTNPNALLCHVVTMKTGGLAAMPNGYSDGYTQGNQSFVRSLAISATGWQYPQLPTTGLDPIPSNPLTYNYNVDIVCHELGHNLGSRHTHWCGWRNEFNQLVGRIDSCSAGEAGGGGSCPANIVQSPKPTIMSYCKDQKQDFFKNGFGKYPRFAMRTQIYNSPEIPSVSAVSPPTLTTSSVTSVTGGSAVAGGTISSDGGTVITAKGVCFATTQNPTLSNSFTSNGIGSDPFTSTMTGLSASTTYYVRAYATNSAGTSYGNQRSFTTTSLQVPTLTTVSPTLITSLSATSGGTSINANGSPVTSRGVCWSTSINPTVNLSTKTSDGSGSLDFTSSITGLTANTTYYVRAYATNSFGTGYGNQITFTSASGPGVVNTSPAGQISSKRARFTGNVIKTEFPVSERGFCWNTSPTPTISNSKLNSGTGLGIYQVNISNLTPNTTYYVRAYCITSGGNFYGNEITFKTDINPTFTITSVSNITTNSFFINWTANVTDGGCGTSTGDSLNSRGMASNSIRPAFYQSDLTTIDGNLGGLFIAESNSGTYTSIVNSKDLVALTPGTIYYVAIRGTDCRGEDYKSNTITVTTLGTGSAPTVTTSSISSITQTSATGGGNVTSGTGLTARGVCWAVSPTVPTISNSLTNDGTSTGVFSSSITGLSASTTYNVRAYATNSGGTSYGSTVSFTTSAATIPTLSTVAASSITQTTATSGGTITSNGGSNITAKGVCWSTSPNPTISLTTKTSDGTGSTNFTSNITGLSPNTLYYVRSYAQNAAGVAYGNELTFTSSSIVIPTITTTSVTTFTNTNATMGGNITSAGGGTVTRRGVCYATTQNPDTTRTVVNIGSGIGTFSQSVTALQPSTTYYVRAFAINSAGISYGTQQSFRTLGPPTMTTTAASSITTTAFTTGGGVTSSGGTGVVLSAKGICYSTTTSPSLTNGTVITDPTTTTASFTTNITGLTSGQTYYVRSYATNIYGTGYGSQITVRTFTTPTVTTTSASSINSTGFTTGGNVTSAGGTGQTISERGIVYSTTVTTPTTTDTKLIAATPTGTGSYTITLSGLTSGTVYYVRAYAINSTGTGYGSTITVTTATVPVLTTTNISTISSTTASSGGGTITSPSSSVTAKGVCWSTTPNPTVALTTKTSNGTGTASFTSSITGLSPSTLYYVRAYATNTTGTGYGNELTFTTTSSGTLPSLTTTTVSSITQTTASSGGNITSAGTTTVTSRGICFATTQNPTTSNNVVNSGTGTGSFTSVMTGLTSNTVYYVRAFATNSSGTSYGGQVSFTTSPANLATLTTSTVSSISQTTAISGGDITSDGGGAVTARGICFATTQNPTIANSIVNSGSGIGSFTSTMTGLTPNTFYYVRAFATNSAGTSYGSQVSFTTLPVVNLPTLTTTNVSTVTQTTATSGGDITSDGGGSVTARGICYAITPNPTLSNNVVNSGTGTGAFTINISGLSPNTTYFLVSFATNSAGTAYGNQIQFTTLPVINLPTLTTSTVSSITQTTATSGGDITSDGGGTVTARGICFATTQNPTTSNSVVNSGTGTGIFTSSITGLTPNTLYYVRAFATNSAGTAYGNQVSFTTLSVVNLPTLTTTTVSSITQTTATSGGNVSSDGGGTVTARGICFATTQNPTTSNSVVNSGTGIGSFTSAMTGLTPNTLYYVRAFATNSAGTAYGAQVSFTTQSTSSTTPTVTTNNISLITQTTATSGGNVTSDGGGTVSARGICFATTNNPTLSNSVLNSGSGLGSFTSNLTGLTQNITYYVRAYATNPSGTSYGGQQTFTTSGPTPTNTCNITGVSAYRINNLWYYRWNINSNCNSYTVSLSRLSTSNPSVLPNESTSILATGTRLTNYVPTASEFTQGFVNLQMSQAPATLNFWYSVNVTCNRTGCSGSTRSFFYVDP